MDQIIYTVGHSTRKRSELIALLKHYGVDTLLDIRAIPYSRYNSQFNREEMMAAMPSAGIAYEHLEALGGKRPPREVMATAKSCSERSHGFAAHMQTEEFREGLAHVLDLTRASRTVVLMCAESDPSHCHRYWVADAVEAEGFTVRHIVTEQDLREHPRNLFTYM